MLEILDLEASSSRETYRERRPDLESRLLQLQRACFEAEIPTVVVVAGWNASGKSRVVRALTRRIEPRAFSVHPVLAPRTHELAMPWMRRFWARLPSRGEMAIFQGSWYREVIAERAEGRHSEAKWLRHCRDIRFFERALADDDHVMAKFFLHLDESEQRRRVERRSRKRKHRWRLHPGDLDRLELYPQYYEATEETLHATETEWAPWTLVPAHDKYLVRLRVFEGLISAMERALVGNGTPIEYESLEAMEAARHEDLSG